MLIDEIPRSWRNALSDFIEKKGGRDILDSLDTLLQGDRGNYNPKRKNIFTAFKKTPFKKVRVVIIGQNPYANPDHATGLAFFAGKYSTPSLVNINCAIKRNFSEATGYNNVEDKNLTNNCLKRWAKKEDVLLLNRVLVFRKDADGTNTHVGKGWEEFIQAVIEALVESERHIHFMLWGNEAQKFKVRNCPECRLHKTYLPFPFGNNPTYVEKFKKCCQFFDVNKEIKDSPRKEKEINWFPPE